MDRTPSAPPLWAARVAPLVTELRAAARGRRQELRGELWQLLHAAVFAALRAQWRRVLPVSTEDLEDLASAKALELLEQAEGNRWEPAGRSSDEIVGYVWRVGRNALVDLARRRGRERPVAGSIPEAETLVERSPGMPSEGEAGPFEMTQAMEFVTDLNACLAALSPRARGVWTHRALLEWPSREIAARFGIKAPHVDVLVQRAREAVTECMATKGHTVGDVHPQAFVRWWQQWSANGRDDEQAAADSSKPRSRGSR